MKLREKLNYIIFVLIILTFMDLVAGLIFPTGAHYTVGEGTLVMLREFLPAYSIAVAIIVLGVAFLLLSELVIKQSKGKRSLTFLSLFAICIAFWIISQNPICITFADNSYIPTCVTHLVLPWALGFIVLFLFYPQDEDVKVFLWQRLLFALPFLYGILVVALDAGGVLSFHVTVILTQLFAILVGIDVVVRSVLGLVGTRFDLKSSVTINSLANLMMAFAAVIDVLRTVAFHTMDYSRDFRLATLIFMIITGLDAIMIYADEQHLISDAGVIKSMAVHDGLTGVYNRMAFNSRLEALPVAENIGFIHFDVNNLKEANDNYGHAEGDQLIKSIAHGIQKAFSDMGDTYRYGGDEFTVITDCFDEDKIKASLGNLRIYLALMNREELVHVQMSMACGYDHCVPGDETVFRAFERADEKMYENKRGMKELEERLRRQ